MHRRSVLVAALLALAVALPVAAQQAVVRSYDAPTLEVGQAWLMRSGAQCLAVLPTHVAAETGVPSLLREGADGRRGEAGQVVDLGDDAAVALLTGGITADCGFPIGSIGRNVTRALRDGGLGTLRSINGDGTVARLAVTVVDDDGQGLLRVLPTSAGEAIRKGHSGSLLLIDDRPVGMLLSVHARSGVGTILRTDALLRKVEGWLRERAAPGAAVTAVTPAVATEPAASEPAVDETPPPDAWQVTAWSADPISAAHRAATLAAAGKGGFWAARAERWPIAIELGGPPAVRILHGVRFVAGDEVAAADRPAQVQVLTAVSADRAAWRVAASGTLQYEDGVAELRFAPVRARRVRVEIYSSGASPGGGSQVALTRLVMLMDAP